MKERLAYIDVLKAVMMFYVVVVHVLKFSLGIQKTFIFDLFELTAMPTFFLVSGYLAKVGDCNDLRDFMLGLLKKAQRLLLPTFVCIFLYIAIINSNPANPILSISNVCENILWYGYWFTPTLFVISFFFAIIQTVSLKRASVIFYLVMIMACPIIMHLFWRDMGPISNCFCIRKSIEYIPFFSLGLLVRLYDNAVQKFLQKDIAYFSLVFGGGIYLIIISIYQVDNYILFSCARLLFAMVVFLAFRLTSDYWQRPSRLSSYLQHVGRNTFGIYLLHYFLVPRNMQYLSPYIEKDIFVQFIVAGSLALLLTACVLVIIRFIRINKILSLLLLGE